jgi:hypothetical protein
MIATISSDIFLPRTFVPGTEGNMLLFSGFLVENEIGVGDAFHRNHLSAKPM